MEALSDREVMGECPFGKELGVSELVGADTIVQGGRCDCVDKERWGEDEDIIIVIVACVVVRTARQCISFVDIARLVGQGEVVVGKSREVAGHTMADAVRLTVILKVFMVCENGNRKGGASKEVLPIVKPTDNSKEFAVVDIIVPFSIIERLGVIADCLRLPSFIFLSEDGACGKCRSVYF
jgi:hypothetical protein